MRRQVVLAIVLLLLAVLALAPGARGLARAGSIAARQWGTSHPEILVSLAFPGRAWGEGAITSPLYLARDALCRVAGVNLADAQEILASQLPAVVARRAFVYLTPDAQTRLDSQARPDSSEDVDVYPPLVAIYHTHTGETYMLDDGVDRFDGRPGGVVDVGRELERILKENGVRVVRSEKIHDVPYNTSYLKSQKTAEELLEFHPDIDVLLDIHRDSMKDRAYAVTCINGQKAATILFVVGSDARQPFPGWRENLAFAQKLAAAANRKYPGLCLDVRVRDGRYNQFLHPQAVLVEIGGVNNHRAEAIYAAQLLGDVLADVLRDEGE